MIYVIDHEDSFTFNLVHLLGIYDNVYTSNYYEIDKAKLNKADVLVLSPGPGEPKNYPETTRIYNHYKGKKKKRIDWNLDMIDSKYSRSRLWCVWCAEEE